MEKIYLLCKIINGEKKYLRYGLNGGGQLGYCVYRGHIVCFDDYAEACAARKSLGDCDLWNIENFVSR